LHAVAPVGAPSAAAAGLHNEWRGYSQSGCWTERRRFLTLSDLVARCATFKNWRLAAEKGSQMALSVTADVVS